MKHMKKGRCLWLICCLLGIVEVVHAQMLKVDGGVAFSKFRTNGMVGNPLFNKAVIPFHMSLGLEYLDKKYFNLSSSVGYLRMGGKEKIYHYNGADPSDVSIVDYRNIIDYVTVNTLFNMKRSVSRMTYYIGIGPRVDFKIGSKVTGLDDNESADEQPPKISPVVFGLKCETGFRYAIDNHLRLGANVSYLPSFTKAWTSPIVSDITLTAWSIHLGVSIGYVL